MKYPNTFHRPIKKKTKINKKKLNVQNSQKT